MKVPLEWGNRAYRRSCPSPAEGTLRVKNTVRPTITVSDDAKGLVFQAGGLLLTRVLRVTGLDRALSQGLER